MFNSFYIIIENKDFQPFKFTHNAVKLCAMLMQAYIVVYDMILHNFNLTFILFCPRSGWNPSFLSSYPSDKVPAQWHSGHIGHNVHFWQCTGTVLYWQCFITLPNNTFFGA